MKPHHSKQKQKQTHWSNVADWYDQLVGDDGSEYHQHVILPGILRMLDMKEKAQGLGGGNPWAFS